MGITRINRGMITIGFLTAIIAVGISSNVSELRNRLQVQRVLIQYQIRRLQQESENDPRDRTDSEQDQRIELDNDVNSLEIQIAKLLSSERDHRRNNREVKRNTIGENDTITRARVGIQQLASSENPVTLRIIQRLNAAALEDEQWDLIRRSNIRLRPRNDAKGFLLLVTKRWFNAANHEDVREMHMLTDEQVTICKDVGQLLLESRIYINGHFSHIWERTECRNC